MVEIKFLFNDLLDWKLNRYLTILMRHQVGDWKFLSLRSNCWKPGPRVLMWGPWLSSIRETQLGRWAIFSCWCNWYYITKNQSCYGLKFFKENKLLFFGTPFTSCIVRWFCQILLHRFLQKRTSVTLWNSAGKKVLFCWQMR